MSDLVKPPPVRLSKLDMAMRPILDATPRLEKLLPSGMNLDRFVMQIRVAMSKSVKLQECTPASIVGAVLEAADLGLDPSGRLGSAYIIPFKGMATLVPGYRGLIDLAGRSGLVRSINAYAVHEKDHFTVRSGFTPEHLPYVPRPGQEQDAGKWYVVWARARMLGGSTESEIMTHFEVMKIKARSPGARNAGGPWDTDEEEMAKKTVIRRLLKKLPLSPTPQWDRLSRALDMADGAVIDGESRTMTPLTMEDGADLALDDGGAPPAPSTKASDIESKL